MTDLKHLRELAESALEPMGDLGEPYSSGSARTAGKYVMAQRQFEGAVTPQTILALLDERDALQARIDAALVSRSQVERVADELWDQMVGVAKSSVREALFDAFEAAGIAVSTPTENGEER